MKKIYSQSALAAVLFFLIIAVSSGCSEKITGSNQDTVVTVAIDTKALSPHMVTAIDRFELTVEGRDFDDRTVPMIWEGNTVVASLEIPVGINRRFVALALSKDGVALYRGEVVADVTSRQVARLTINMRPMVPMINITPHYQSFSMTTPVSIDVNVFNIPNLVQIDFEVLWNSAPCYLDTIVRGDNLVETAMLGYQPSYSSAAVSIFNGNQAYTITSPAGHAHLATVTFGTHSDWSADTATIAVQVLPRAAWLMSGQQIPIDSIYTDDARIFLFRPVLSPQEDRILTPRDE